MFYYSNEYEKCQQVLSRIVRKKSTRVTEKRGQRSQNRGGVVRINGAAASRNNELKKAKRAFSDPGKQTTGVASEHYTVYRRETRLSETHLIRGVQQLLWDTVSGQPTGRCLRDSNAAGTQAVRSGKATKRIAATSQQFQKWESHSHKADARLYLPAEARRDHQVDSPFRAWKAEPHSSSVDGFASPIFGPQRKLYAQVHQHAWAGVKGALLVCERKHREDLVPRATH